MFVGWYGVEFNSRLTQTPRLIPKPPYGAAMTLFTTRLALALITTASVVSLSQPAWAQMPRPNFPIRQEQVSSEVQATAPDAATVRAPDEVEAREAPGVPPPGPEAVESRPLETPAIVRAAPRPVVRTVIKQSVTGRVVNAAGPAQTHKVKSGDSLDAIARSMGVDRKELAELNGLKSPYPLNLGQVIKGPRSDAKAYVVGQGDTLFSIAQRFSVTAKALASANDVSVGRGLNPGRKLILPSGYRDKGPIRTKTQVADETATEVPMPTKSTRTSPTVKSTRPEPVEAEIAPRPSTRVVTSVTGKLVEFTGKPVSYRVRKGDALDAIAHDLGMTRKELAELNKLKPPYALQPGKVLKGPPEIIKGYVPVEGDTLALIAKRFSVTPRALAAMNGMRPGAAVRPGKRLTLPGGFRDRGPVKETIRTAPAATLAPTYSPPQPRPAPVPYSPAPYVSSTPTAPPVSRPISPPPTQSGPLSDAQISSLGKGRFIWPLRGDVISDFGPKGTGQRNDGVNIRAQAGEPIRAAAAGDVVYSGDQVPGFGNLVLVKHADGWVTAYGHLARIDVKMQQRVAQGQQLGQAGSTGGVAETQLHFEVRYAPSPSERARPVDPQLVLGR